MCSILGKDVADEDRLSRTRDEYAGPGLTRAAPVAKNLVMRQPGCRGAGNGYSTLHAVVDGVGAQGGMRVSSNLDAGNRAGYFRIRDLDIGVFQQNAG